MSATSFAQPRVTLFNRIVEKISEIHNLELREKNDEALSRAAVLRSDLSADLRMLANMDEH